MKHMTTHPEYFVISLFNTLPLTALSGCKIKRFSRVALNISFYVLLYILNTVPVLLCNLFIFSLSFSLLQCYIIGWGENICVIIFVLCKILRATVYQHPNISLVHHIQDTFGILKYVFKEIDMINIALCLERVSVVVLLSKLTF